MPSRAKLRRRVFKPLIDTLVSEHVRFVVIGGVAINLRGHARMTEDFDVAYARDRENFASLVHALGPYRPRLRGADDSLPFFWDEPTLRQGCNFTLDTELGPIDLLGEVTGIGSYDKVEAFAEPMPLYGHDVLVLTVDGLIVAKRAAGRAKDLLDLGFLVTLKQRNG